MKKPLKLLILPILIFLTILLFSCSASVQMTYYKDPDYKGPFLTKILVEAVIKDVDYKNAYENGICKSLRNAGAVAVPGSEILTNTTYDESQMIDVMNKNNINGLLILRYTKANISTIVFPKRTYAKYYNDAVSMINSPNYSENPDTLNIECTLFETGKGNAIWIATTKASEYYNLNNLGSSLGNDIVKNLQKNNIIR